MSKDKTQASCPFCGQLSPYGVRIREQEYEREIRIARLIDLTVDMQKCLAKHAYDWTQVAEETADYYREQLEALGVSLDD